MALREFGVGRMMIDLLRNGIGAAGCRRTENAEAVSAIWPRQAILVKRPALYSEGEVDQIGSGISGCAAMPV